MLKKLICIFICFSMLALSGCSESRRIDTAALAEDVSVDLADGQIVYTFYLLSSDENPWPIEIPAQSLEQACLLARQKYIPNISLPKIKLLMINEKLYKAVLKQDIEYISSQPELSPLIYVALCDGQTAENMKTEKRVSEIIENELLLIKDSDKSVSTNCLSVYNGIIQDNNSLCISYISSQKELKIDTINIIL